MVQLSWENFGLAVRREHQNEADECCLLVPATSSLQTMCELAEARGPEGLVGLIDESVRVLRYVARGVFCDWSLAALKSPQHLAQDDVLPLDVAALHRMVKDESRPDYVRDVLGGVEISRLLLSNVLSRELAHYAEGLELPGTPAAMEVGLNLRNTQLHLRGAGGRLLLQRGVEWADVPEPGEEREE